MKEHLQYAGYIARHKYFVGAACFKEGLLLRGLLHDWHKLLPSEWTPYVRFFYGKKTTLVREAFERAWLRHQRRAEHHWQWWVLRKDNGKEKPLRMSPEARMEMLCDWYGAGQAQGKGGWMHTLEWYTNNKSKMCLHPETREWVERTLASRSGKDLFRPDLLVGFLKLLSLGR